MIELHNQNMRKPYHMNTFTEMPREVVQSNCKLQIFFSSQYQNTFLPQLLKELKENGISYRLNENYQSLSAMISYKKTKDNKLLVLVITYNPHQSDSVTIFPTDYKFPYPEENMKLYFFPYKYKGDQFEHFKSVKEVLTFCKRFLNEQQCRIKLTSVHSIKRSKEKNNEPKKSLKSINSGHEYESLLYQTDLYHEYDTKMNSFTYESVIEALQGMEGAEPFKTFKDIEKKQPKGSKKILILTSTNEKSLKLAQTIHRQKIKYFDIMMLGDMNPANELLQKRVIIATNDVKKITSFLIDNGFASNNLRNYHKNYTIQRNSVNSSRFIANMNNLMRQSSQSFNSTQPFNLKGVNKEVPVHHWYVDKDPSNSNKFKTQQKFDDSAHDNRSRSSQNTQQRFVSPGNGSETTETEKKKIKKMKSSVKKKQQEIDIQDQNTGIVISEIIKKETHDDYYGSAGERNIVQNGYNKRMLNEGNDRSRPNQIQNSSKNGSYNSSQRNNYNNTYQNSRTNVSRPPPKEPQFVKPSLGFAYQYRNHPSNIIHEVSEEYRGSNKQSIMNIEPDTSFKTMRNPFSSNNIIQSQNMGPSSPIQQNSSNKKNNNSSAYVSYQDAGYNSKISDKSPQQNRLTPINYNSSGIQQKIVPNQGTYISATSSNSTGIRTYGRVNGQVFSSPSKVVKKSQISSPEQYKEQVKPNIQQTSPTVRLLSPQNNGLSPYSLNGAKQSINNSQVVTYHKLKHEPTDDKGQISFGKVKQIIPQKIDNRFNYGSPIDQLRNLTNNSQQRDLNNAAFVSPQKIEGRITTKIINNTGINLDQYERIQKDGRVVYQKKSNLSQLNTESKISNPKNIQNNNYQPKENIGKQKPKITIDYAKKDTLNAQPYSPTFKNNDQHIPIDIDQMIESSHKKKKNQEKPTIQINKNIDKWTNATYETKVYGAQRVDRYQPKVQARNANKLHANMMNQSNMYSRMSQLHSDGSILRRNNIRFGIKLPLKKKEYEPAVSIMQSKLVSGIYKVNDLTKKNTLNRIITGDQYLSAQRQKLLHINCKFNNFHFIIQQEMSYLSESIKAYISNPNDKIQLFTGTEQLFECLRPDKIDDKFDVGFIFIRKHQMNILNINLFPQDYYVVLIERQNESTLQVNQNLKLVRIDQLKNLTLAQKLIIDSKLYQYVAYRNHKKIIQIFADKFLNSQFILQKIQTQFTSQIIDFYYCQLPRLTRLYLICDQKQLPELLKLIKIYQQFNPSFNKDSCKLLCIISNILNNDDLIMNHPTVTFISNPEEMRGYTDILRYAHHMEEDKSHYMPIDHLYYHSRHKEVEDVLQKQFPGRFVAVPFSKMSEVYLRVQKTNKINQKYGCKQKNFLVLHQSLNNEKINIAKFTKVFMLGKVKMVQSQVIKVLNVQQLFQVLRV